ncbi:hypothetical protein EIP91_009212 [Steccherinum ochraceum]|uniref:EF-hand domain-containing protein n=1 Tax=Steccherinum ochraceum TaxID=92696 RepID=A0A4R0RJZ8_9APHY|nr:hypothetical protein EIP91_009212 [Steccherinum ochraceum]
MSYPQGALSSDYYTSSSYPAWPPDRPAVPRFEIVAPQDIRGPGLPYYNDYTTGPLTGPLPPLNRARPESARKSHSELHDIPAHAGSEDSDPSYGRQDTIEVSEDLQYPEEILGKALAEIPDSSLDAMQTTLTDQLPFLSSVLVDLTKIHPVISVAVVAFKVALELYLAHKNNDLTVVAVYCQMKDTMDVLTYLKHNEKGTYSRESRLARVCVSVANDIKECAKVHDAFIKISSWKRWAKAMSWKAKLSSVLDQLSIRQKELIDAVILETSATVMSIENQLRDLSRTPELQNRLTQAFQRKATRDSVDAPEPDAAVKDTADAFQRKFSVRSSQLDSELETIRSRLEDLGERLGMGPHDLIHDAMLRELWKDMAWKRNVKTSRFVTTLRDYLRETHNGKHVLSSSDVWVVKYVDMRRLRSIEEALDIDSSGYLSIGELNRFTDACPTNTDLKWSLPHWIAYWAAGWKLASLDRKRQIHDIMDKMYAMIPYILPQNRIAVGHYVALLRLLIPEITLGLSEVTPSSEEEYNKFAPYIRFEEAQVNDMLRQLEYTLDAVDTVHIVAGSERIEEKILTVILILLRHHFRLLQKGQHEAISIYQLREARMSLRTIHKAVQDRANDLAASFQHRDLDLIQHFQGISSGLFYYVYNQKSLWSKDRLRHSEVKNHTERENSLTSLPREDLVIDPDALPREVVLRYTAELSGDSKGTPTVQHQSPGTFATRFMCMDCTGFQMHPELIWDTLNFCSEECFGQNINHVLRPEHSIMGTTLPPHVAHHTALRLSVEVPWVDLPTVFQQATEARISQDHIRANMDPRRRSGAIVNKCSVCEYVPPAWLCVECSEQGDR